MAARAGDYVIGTGRLLGGTSGHVIRTRWGVFGWALVEADSGRFLKGKRLWLPTYTLAVVDPPEPQR